MHHPELRTERLLLRDFRRADIPDIVRLAGAREVAANTLRIPHPYTAADAETFLRLRAEKSFGYSFAITLFASGELCGAVGLHPDAVHPRAELGYWIGVPYWGRGYATEAARAVLDFGFRELKLQRIFAHHFEGNPASARVLQKLGMKHEGCSRQHIKKWGELLDLENYGILRSEWK
ncbi:MAG TPA: GNAT family N-acetyltransferase [Terriglobales bacterium]|nr:GNAT family N-acetyltransferase [Terriglobales bacterium]